MKRNVFIVVLGLCCGLMSGCYEKVTDANGITFSFQTWVPVLVLLAGIVAVPVGVVIFRIRDKFWGAAVAILGLLAAVALAPGMFMDRVVVNQQGFYSSHGFWWDSTVHDIRYDQLASIQLVVEEQTGRRGRKNYNYSFECVMKSGKRDKVPLGDIMREALPEIAEQFRKNGVKVQMPPNLPG